MSRSFLGDSITAQPLLTMTDNTFLIDSFIKEHRLTEYTSMPIERIRLLVLRAMTANNLAFILADVINSFIMDCESDLSHFDKCFSRKAKRHFKLMQQNIKAARKWSQELSVPIYKSVVTDSLCADSDWWYALIKLIDDRVSDNAQRCNQFLEYLLNMPEGNSPYKVKAEDFKVFKP